MLSLVLLNIGLELVPPLLLSRFIDEAVTGAGLAALQQTAIEFVAVTVCRQFVVSIAGYLSQDIGWRATNTLRMDLVEHCLGLDMSFHKTHAPGELIERIDGDVSMLAQFFAYFVFELTGRLALVAGILVLTFLVDWRIGALLGAFGVVSVLALRRLRGIAVPHFRALRVVSADLSAFFEENINATEDIRANGARGHARSKLGVLLDKFSDETVKSSVSGRYYSSALEVTVAVAGASTLLLGAVLLRHHSITFGQVYLGFSYMNLLAVSLSMITRQLNQFQSASAGVNRIAELFDTERTIQDGRGGRLAPGSLSIEFDEVGFSYTPDRPTLQQVSFSLDAGQTLGLVGRTGSGKTTIGRLVFRGVDAGTGRVRIGGQDVRLLGLDDLRARVGVVTQDVQLFHATVRDNLTLFDPDVPARRIEEGIDELGLTGWYRGLEDGLDTVIRSGHTLSAGEAQLLAFTRVLLRQPDIVILDEASSLLDPATEKLLDRAMSRLLDGRTAIVIAHRLSTLDYMDQIMVLDQGRILEQGSRADLVHDADSHFAKLLTGAIA
ncbi:ABC transporter ATP-binding protein [Nocardia spumae]|uniref:ABC transporter ATP-binding protein n=1 Tax=Nocardia spumae TaxID=2887190 RepID=UPI001D14E418|nr:ABC transporter ATP-binding protein [Nocardia spumae]